jgi:hypothetical protein
MGILARPRLRAGRMPTPQENFEDFFICKSLSDSVTHRFYTLIKEDVTTEAQRAQREEGWEGFWVGVFYVAFGGVVIPDICCLRLRVRFRRVL